NPPVPGLPSSFPSGTETEPPARATAVPWKWKGGRGMRPISLLFVVLVSVLLAAVPAAAQSPNSAAIVVVVSGPSDALVLGAAVTVINTATGAVREATTGRDGSVTLTALPLTGEYRIAVK